MDEAPNEQRRAPPDIIAKHINRAIKSKLPTVTNFDYLCFAAQTLAAQSLENPVFRNIAIELNKIVYAIYENYPVESCVKLANSPTVISTSTESSTVDTTKST